MPRLFSSLTFSAASAFVAAANALPSMMVAPMILSLFRIYFLSAQGGQSGVNSYTSSTYRRTASGCRLFLRALYFFDLHGVQIQRIKTRVHGIGGLDEFGVGHTGGVNRSPASACFLMSLTASVTVSVFPLALRRPMTISTAAASTEPMATS